MEFQSPTYTGRDDHCNKMSYVTELCAVALRDFVHDETFVYFNIEFESQEAFCDGGTAYS